MDEQPVKDDARAELSLLDLAGQGVNETGFSWQDVEDDAELSWQERALCAQTDPEAFFPEKGGSTREAKKVCVSCEVRAECLEYALENDERFGIWGGLSERERRKLKRRAV
ncbi:WhiB family transcriptional regulator [Brachybacterium alimentarium]|uniref:WhiB family transcriptional regulator n=1 Tax=Brachybacterium alimentarium TaxID=47845 RepID=UPI003FD601FF